MRWELPFEPRGPGAYELRARATDASGLTQPAAVPFNDNGYQFWATARAPVPRGPRASLRAGLATEPLTQRLAAGARPAKQRAYRLLVGRLRVVPRSRSARPYAMFGFARVAELRWRLLLRRRPVLTPEQYAAQVTVADIEELLACQLCGERRVQPLLNPSRPRRWGYHVVRCPSCGFMYRNPGIKPERFGELYGKGNYGRFLTGRYARKRKRGYRQIMGEFSPLLDDGAGRRLLDYGSGAGLFLQVAHRRGFEGYGVDLAPDAVALAREQPGSARSYVGMPHDVPEIAAGGFDVVTLWSVLAHLPTARRGPQ